ncbi:protein-L-isoaspartate(D-aspartate) O-methyltransferase [Pseudohalioglobus sediminis]|uniref:Protein-L-isoaspartate(D-aspartate) O-methyltransferase n=1 Tax=Pseudohalioglobus sediminis TaxID=2606449 RepID=A0A5B0X460_9GAMM|nr:ATPase, T2SS/T4P/T4SS family [Pseudohalioglobus sediminis]KAA1194042.1 protein-L-isoaspartate(D-aspartate) O-methyltransferase [Pseudohalioglobus sediminis]
MKHRGMSVAERVTIAMRTLPRDHFIEMSDPSLVIGHSIPPTNAVSEILEHAAINPEHKVMLIGTGAGYVAALASKLASQVVALEINPAMAHQAQRRFNELGLANLVQRTADGRQGAEDLGPYDRILVSTPHVIDKAPLIGQLADGGMLLAIEIGENDCQILTRYEVSELGATLRKELAMVDFSRDTGMTLLDMGMVDQVMLSEARRMARDKKLPVIKVLRDKLNMEDIPLYRRLAEEKGMPFAAIDDLLPQVQPDLMEGFSRSFLDSHHLIPLRVEDRGLQVVTDDPDSAVEDIFHMYPYERVSKVLVTPNDFKRLWTTVELSLQGNAKQQWNTSARPKEKLNEDLLDRDKPRVEAHLITLCDALLLDAVSEGASDLHIEQYKHHTRIRLRVDGDLHDLNHYSLAPQDARGLINVIKIRGDMDIAEKRLPQGGRSQLTAGGVNYDLRIQVQPTLHGEAAVIRMLPQTGNIVAIEDLGMSSRLVRDYRRLLQNPSGLVLVVGPTGSGKSTTLYAGLSELAKDGRRKVLTIEDPIEYSIEGIQQTWTRPDIGFNFADGMRSFVRLDPDIVLVGEIRDTETALEAIRASQTGHVVLSTLHANDAVDALQRIYDLEVHANSVASELMAVIAQKLAKRICPHCREAAEPDPDILAELFPEGVPDNFRCYRGAGCKACNNRGTSGRVAVVEYMQVNSEIRTGISLRYPIAQLRAVALDSGLLTMRDSALAHVAEGVIPLSELPRVLPSERMAPEKRGAW